LEDVTHIIARYDAIEKWYFSEAMRRSKDFEDSILRLYCKILEFEATAACYFARNTVILTLRNIIKLDDWLGLLLAIDKCDKECKDFAAVRSSQMLIQGMNTITTVLERRKKEIQEKLDEYGLMEDRNGKIMAWISKVSVGDQHAYVRNKKLGSSYWSSGQWLLGSESFARWKKDLAGQFWLQGAVGTGKSCLTSIVINYLIENPIGERFAFFYCSRGSGADDQTSILRSLVAQLSCSADGLTIDEEVRSLYDKEALKYTKGAQLDSDQCADMLAGLIERHGETVIVIDALDECIEPVRFLRQLKKVSTRSQELKLFFSSRMDVPVLKEFPDAVKIRVESSRNSADISSYVNSELEKFKSRHPNVWLPEYTDRLLNIINDRAQGM
jgi:hypothetical protein